MGPGFQIPVHRSPGIASGEQFPGQFTDEQIVHVKGTVKTPDDLNTLQDMLLNVRRVMAVSSEVAVEEGEIGTPVE